jgi:hypothetical protein
MSCKSGASSFHSLAFAFRRLRREAGSSSLSLRSCVGMTTFEDMLQSASDSRSSEKIQATGLPLRSGGQEVDVGFGDQVFFGDVEGGEQVVGDFLAFLFGLFGTEHYF